MKASEYNQFSAAMQKRLKPDERATYRVLNVRPDPDNFGKFLMPSAYQIPPTDVVYDKTKGDFVTIAAIERIDNEGNPVFLNIVFTAANLGYLFLNGSNPVHQKIYQFVELCNYNSSNKDRNDIDNEAIFYRVDNKKEAIEERSLRKLIVKAVNTALELDDKKAKEVAMALGIDAETIEEIRNQLEDFSEENPEEFMDIVERASLSLETMIKEAIKKGVIKNDVNAQVFSWSETGKELMKYKKAPNKNYIKDLADYLEENAPDELEAIKNRLG
jgi:hypothetical protein